MKYKEFKEQDEWCKKNNLPDGIGCDGCSGKEKPCADELRNLMGKVIDSKFKDTQIIKEIERKFGLSEYNILALVKGKIEFPE